MKNFKIGLTTLVAIAAMSFTVASKDGILDNAKVADGCYTSVTIDQTPPNPPKTYTSSQSPTNPANGNPKPHCSTIDVPNPPGPVSSASGAVSNSETTGCPSPYNNFCCFRVVNNVVTTICYRS